MPRWRTSGSCSNPTIDERSVAQVNVSINSRQYRMACEDGQEDHLRQLAKDLDDRINTLRGQFGEIGDSRLVVMAALMIADERTETGQKVPRPGTGNRGLAGRPRRLRRARAGDPDRTDCGLYVGGGAN